EWIERRLGGELEIMRNDSGSLVIGPDGLVSEVGGVSPRGKRNAVKARPKRFSRFSKEFSSCGGQAK
ncbi:unnamed protein product, partial [Durusdinium trenchii]